MNKKKLIALIILNLILLIVFSVINAKKTPLSVDLTKVSLSEEAINSAIKSSDSQLIFENSTGAKYENAEPIEYEPIQLPKGSYDVIIEYKTDADNNYFTLSSSRDSYIDSLYAEDLTGFLPSLADTHTSHIRITKDYSDLNVQIFYWGDGCLSIEKVNVSQTNADFILYETGLFLVLLLFDLCVIKWKFIAGYFSEEKYHYTVALLLLIIIASLPVFTTGIYTGHDSGFHITRMEGLKEAIISLQFPAKMHSTHLFGYGYATGQMYPQLFLYPVSILRIFGMSRVGSHRILIIMVNILTVLISYYSFKKIIRISSVAFSGTVLYTLAPYRIVDLYIRDCVGEYCAMIGLPLIIWGLYSFISNSCKDEKPAWLSLAIGYTIVIESHLLTTLFVGIYSIAIGIIFLRRLIRKECIIALGKTIVAVIFLNAGFLVPLLDYMRLPMNQFVKPIKPEGVDLIQLFTNELLYASNGLYSNATQPDIGEVRIDNEMPYAIGWAIIVMTTSFLLLWRRERSNRLLGAVSFAFGTLNAILALYCFPWEIVEKCNIFRFIANVQFPWRFLMFATIGYTISSCVGIKYLMNRIPSYTVILITCLIAVFGYINIVDYLVEVVPIEEDISIEPEFLGKIKEYLFQGTDPYELISQGECLKTSSEELEISEYEKLGTNLSFKATNKSNSTQAVELPLVMYPGYKARGSNGNRLDVTYGTNQVVCVMVPAGFDSTIFVYFGGKWYWKVATLISMTTAFVLIFCMLKPKWRKKC